MITMDACPASQEDGQTWKQFLLQKEVLTSARRVQLASGATLWVRQRNRRVSTVRQDVTPPRRPRPCCQIASSVQEDCTWKQWVPRLPLTVKIVRLGTSKQLQAPPIVSRASQGQHKRKQAPFHANIALLDSLRHLSRTSI